MKIIKYQDICNKMNRTGDYDTKRNKPDTGRQILHLFAVYAK